MDLLQTSSSSSSDDEDVPISRKTKVYRNREDLFDKFDELEFFQRFRLTKRTCKVLLEGGSIKAETKLLLTLRFYATGSMLRSVADFTGVSIASACRIIKKVSGSIAELGEHYIKMPSTNEELEVTAAEFYRKARFPRVIGAIDCTLIRIDSPGGDDAEIYRTRKQFFGVNVQTVSDCRLRIRNIVARWPGSTHDETIFNNSHLKRQFEEGVFKNYLLVGDAGYHLRQYLMTKLQHVNTAADNLYNESIIRTRNVVESNMECGRGDSLF
nr:unnamed protein product [Callosobruchus analis]